MKSAGEFDRASRMASKVYQAIGDQKKVFMFRKLVSIGKRGLRDGIGKEEIARRFQEYLREVLNK